MGGRVRETAWQVCSVRHHRRLILWQAMKQPEVMRPADAANWQSDRMGKSTLFESPRMLVGLNAFEPGQAHALHAHQGMDKMYYVIEGTGLFLLEGRQLKMSAGDVLVAAEGVPHGVRNDGPGRLLVMAVLAPFHGKG